MERDCICHDEKNHKGLLRFLRSVITILKHCSANPILYDKNHKSHNDMAAKKVAWEKVIIEYASLDVDNSRYCVNECTLRGLMRRTRNYLLIIAGTRKNSSMHGDVDPDLSNETVDKENMAAGLAVLGQILELMVLHPLLYDARHKDYKNDTKTLAVWNHICTIVIAHDPEVVSYEFHARFTECMLQRIANPINFIEEPTANESPKSNVYNITCFGTVHIQHDSQKLSINRNLGSSAKLDDANGTKNHPNENDSQIKNLPNGE